MLVNLATLAFVASTCVGAISPQEIASDIPVSSLLSSAQTYLSQGQTSDALVYYDAAISKDPTNYLTYFKRATTFLSLGRTNQATDDFNHVLRLKPGFEGAHLQLGKIRARVADWDGAIAEYKKAQKSDGPDMDQLVEARGAAKLAEAAEKNGNWDECSQQATVAITVASRSAHFRELRSRCKISAGDVLAGISDLQTVLQLRPGNTDPHITISATLFYAMGDSEQGLAQIRKCLQSDPDNKLCKKIMRAEKTAVKTEQSVQKSFQRGQFSTGVRKLIPNPEDSGLLSNVREQMEELRKAGYIPANAPNRTMARLVGMVCKAYYRSNSRAKAAQYCPEALDLDENFVYGLLHKAKKQVEDELYEAAIQTIEKAREVEVEDDDTNKIINDSMNNAQVALKRSRTKDYYKVLGVQRDADDRQIKSAYRKLSKQHHPDKAHAHGMSKEVAEKKMSDINQAYEYLIDPETRAVIDRGEDPADQGSMGGGNPFGGGRGGFPGHMFNQQQRGGYKFHFPNGF